MRYFAVIGRHELTSEQVQLAAEQDVALSLVGDVDAFNDENVNSLLLSLDDQQFEGIVCAHQMIAITALLDYGFAVGTFENGHRPPVDGKASFAAKSFRIRENPHGLSYSHS